VLSQLTGLLAAAAVGDDLDTGSKIAENATTYNYLFHAELVEREQKLNACTSPAECQSVRDYYNNLDATRNKEFGQYCRQNPAGCANVTQQLADEIPANEKLLEEVRVSGSKSSFAHSIQLWLSAQNNQQAINTSIAEKSRSENGEVVGLLTDVALDALYPSPDLFSSTAGGKGGTTGVKVGVIGDGAKGIENSLAKLSQGQQRAVSKIDKILNNFKDSDITGTLRDMAGNPVPKPSGGYWDHLKEMSDTLRGLRNHAETLKGVSEPAAQFARQRALDTIHRIESALNGAGI